MQAVDCGLDSSQFRVLIRPVGFFSLLRVTVSGFHTQTHTRSSPFPTQAVGIPYKKNLQSEPGLEDDFEVHEMQFDSF